MTTTRDPFAEIRAVANATLYEGYILYPYRASSPKNQMRWQFGVLMPPNYVARDDSEHSSCTTQVLLDAPADARLVIEVRFLHARQRSRIPAAAGADTWHEALECVVPVKLRVADVEDTTFAEPFSFPEGAGADEPGSRHDQREVRGTVEVHAERLVGPYGTRRLTVVVTNCGVGDPRTRDDALREAMISTHTLIHVDRGHFLSLSDPPEWARPYADACRNVGTWPAVGSSQDVVLSSPIILGDNPQIAPESVGALYDGTEIDEILTLRTMALTDAEKAEARTTDPRAAELIDRVDSMPQEYLDRLHGAVRYLRTVTGEPEPPTFTTPDHAPWWDPGADGSVSPESDAIVIDGVRVSRGSRVVLRPGLRRTDAQDAFLAGRTATVEAVFFDVDGLQHLGVILDEDPELAEVQRWQGRFLYFAPDEVGPVPPQDEHRPT